MRFRSLPPGWRTTVVHVVIPVGLTIILFASAILGLTLPVLRDTMMNSKREMARELTATVCDLLADYERRVQTGELTREGAQARATERIRSLRYGPEGKDYFWINDEKPAMVMHPYRSDLDGQDIAGFADPEGKHLFVEMVQRVRESDEGAGYVDYMWQWKDDPNRIVPKVSHVRLFRPWGWIVGTGIYVEDVRATISSVTRNLAFAHFGILAVVGALSVYIILQGFHLERDRLLAQEALRDSQQRLSDIISFLPDATFVIDGDGKVIAWNRAIEVMTGVPASEMLGKGDHEYAVPFGGARRPLMSDFFLAGPEVREENYESFTREEGRIAGETFVPNVGGKDRYLYASASALYDRSGGIAGAIESIRDITERRLAEAERARLSAIVDATSDLVSTSEPTSRLTYMNRAGRRLLGWSDEEDVSKREIHDIHPSWAMQIIRNQGISVAIEQGLWTGETAILGPDGHEVPVSQVIMSHMDANGKFEYLSTIMRDITERTRAEEELRISEAKHRTLFETSLDGLVLVALDGSIEDANPAYLSMLGYTMDEVRALRYQDFTPEKWWGMESDIIEHQIIAQGYGKAYEKEYIHKDGAIFPVQVLAWLIRDEHGNPQRMMGIVRDVTERKRAETEMMHLRNLLRNIIDSMPSVLVGVDSEGCVTQWNLEAEKATGIRGEEAQGRRIDTVLPDLALQMDRVQDAMRTRETQYEAKVQRSVEGETRFNDVTVYPLVANGIEGAVVRVDDVTQRVRIEEMMIQSEKMMSVGGLAAGMAHEINNPLAGILQNVQVVQSRLGIDMPKNKRAAEECGVSMDALHAYVDQRGILRMLEAVMDSGRRAARIVDNMLNFSRKSESRFAPRDVADLLDKTLALAENDYDLKKRYDFRQIQIVRDYDLSTAEVPCEATKLQQVFLNILKNGAESMAAKAAAIRDEAETLGDRSAVEFCPQFVLTVRPDGAMVRVEITDNGPGMKEAVRKRIFEPFYTTKDVGKGTGLGLSVSYFIIVENHGGEMLVESTPGEMTRFIIRLPREEKTQ